MGMIGACGNDCLYCPRYGATQSGSAEDMERVRDLWVRLGLRGPAFPAASLVCHGCAPENTCAYPELRACVHGKGLESCGLCEAYPCALVRAALEKSEGLRSRAAATCASGEMEMLEKAFFSKRQNMEARRPGKRDKGGPAKT